MDRRARLAATERAEGILGQIMKLADRREPLLNAYAKRQTALMDRCGKHVLIVASLRDSYTGEAAKLRLERECEVAIAVLVTIGRLRERYEQEAARIESQLAKLLEELWPALRPIGARERGRLMANFNFWLQKTKGRNKNGHASHDSSGTSPDATRGVGHPEATD